MDVRRLEIPAELAGLLHLAQDHCNAPTNQVTEVSPPEVKAKATFSLPSDINNFPFSTFVRTHFQDKSFPVLGQPLEEPLTQLQAEYRQSALKLNKLILRFVGDGNLPGRHEQLLGNYIVSQGLASLPLRNELLSQVATQLWKNPDLEQCQRGWVLMATLLSAFTPLPPLEKPLLKFVSDHGMESYNGICQHKVLASLKQMESDPEVSRSFPPTCLEWTTNQRKGKMILEVCTFKEERISAEVESWTTGEQYAGWILSSRGLDTIPRGWSISMLTGNQWQDLAGCDFVLDLIGEIEEGSYFSQPPSDYLIVSEWDMSSSQETSPDRTLLDIPPAPTMKAPSFPPPPLPPTFEKAVHPGTKESPKFSRGLDHYVDGLFQPLLDNGSRTSTSEVGSEANLTGRMKGGGKIGPTHQGVFPGYSGMMNMPVYQPAPALGGMMPATMPGMGSMPAMGMPLPMMPSLDPSQAAAQQQSFINQQALLLAQQMTLQAMTLSQLEQQRQQRARSPESSSPRQLSSQFSNRRSPERSRPRQASPQSSPESSRRASSKRRSPERSKLRQASPLQRSPNLSRNRRASTEEQSSASSKPSLAMSSKSSNKDEPTADLSKSLVPIRIIEETQPTDIRMDSLSRGSFQKKIDFFQRMGYQTSPIKKLIPPSEPSSRSPVAKEQSEEPNASPDSNSGWSAPTQVENDKEQKGPNGKPLKLAQQPEPSQEIRNIIKMHKNRPVPPPKPITPVRNISKPFVKKFDPKEEALAKLGMPSSASPEKNNEKIQPLPLLPPTKPSNSIKEKQLPLMNLFVRPPQSTGLVLPPPPAEPPAFPPYSDRGETGRKARTALDEAPVKTQLHNLSASVSFSYANPTWKLFLRKEVFYPKENFSHPYCLNLLCDQVLRDTYSESCIRISKEERRKMKDLLVEFQVGTDVGSIQEEGIKKRIVVAARDNWANYFSRLFPVKGENGSDVQILGVSHRGLQLLKKSKEASFSPEHLKTLCSFSYADVFSLELIGRNILQFSLKNEQVILHSPKARQIKATVETFLQELKQDSNYVIAVRSYITDDKSLLNFKKGDFIRLLPMNGLQQGWQFGSIGGRSGLFPSAMVQTVAAPNYLNLHMNQQAEVRTGQKKTTPERTVNKENSTPSMESEGTNNSSAISPLDVCHYTMKEFAMAHFQEAQSKLVWKGMGVDQKNLTLLVQHTKVPLQEALLVHSDEEINDVASDNFMTLMRFMGDQPGLKKKDEVDYVYEILQLCREKENLQDEVYCQVIKQITENPDVDSCHRGWQLLSLLTGYFLPSSALMPYATKFLQQACSDASNPCSGTAITCLSNLRKVVLYGGRRHLPFRVELEAFLKGHFSRRISVILPGDLEHNTRIKTFTVAANVLTEICEQIGVIESEEVQEFAILANKDNGSVVRPLRQKEYIHDYLLEESSIRLNFCRITWKILLHFDNEMYTSIHYNQVLQNYRQGKLLLQHTSKLGHQLGTLALLQHWAKGAGSLPSREELEEYIPDSITHISSEVIQIAVAYQWENMAPLEPQEAQIHFIEHVIQLPFFGYNVYTVERTSIPEITTPCLIGVNQDEIVVVDRESQICHHVIPLKQLLRMKTLRPLVAGIPGLEINYSSVESPRTIWFELQQAKALYHMIAVVYEEAAQIQ